MINKLTKLCFILVALSTMVGAQNKGNVILKANLKNPTSNATPDLSVPASRNCGVMDYQEQEFLKKPYLRESRRNAEIQMQKFLNEDNTAKKNNQVVVTIPVVVHVVYNNATENISDAQINSQISVLNLDFRKLNADISSIPGPFAGLAADAEIQFCLASTDPSGNPTTGITRTASTHGSFYLENDVKYATTGGHDVWNPDNYLNIWVCRLSNNLLGYAQFPGLDPATDGVVIGYTCFGTLGTAQSPYNLGRTATHEIGHYFDLLHIWGDEDACAADDEVTDTPQQKASNGGCPNYPLVNGAGASCSGTAPGAMFMNYMDYVNDACMYMFTTGQKARIQAALNGPRASLMSSTACNSVTPVGGVCDTISNIPANVTVSNYSIYDNVNGTWGYVSGHNSYGDIGKAEKLSNFPAGYKLKGLYFGFGTMVAGAPNSTFNVKAYDVAGNGGPGNTLGTLTYTYSSCVAAVNAGQLLYFEFPSPISVPTTFFAGVEFDYNNSDTLSILTTAVDEVGPGLGWEKIGGANPVWQPYSQPLPAGWGYNLSNFIAAVLCDTNVGVEKIESVNDIIKLYPNPANTSISLNLASNENYSFKIYDSIGKEVQVELNKNTGIVNFDISALSNGLYFVYGISNNSSFAKPFLVKR